MICTTGKVVVPPMFDDCSGSTDFIMVDTLAAVEINGKLWLTPRDGSGRLMNDFGYDSISRSYCFAFVKNGVYEGLLDARTGNTMIPCEMDWVISNQGINMFLGKDDKVGIFESELLNAESLGGSKLYLPIYDAIDVATGQLCLNGKWGWVLRDGGFVEKAPSCDEVLYIPSSVPLTHNGESVFYVLRENCLKIEGLPNVRISKAEKPSSRLKLPRIDVEKIKYPINPIIAKLFSDKDSTMTMPDTSILSMQLEETGDDYWNATISWIDHSSISIGADQAFPLINGCHAILFSEDGEYRVKFVLNLSRVKLEVLMAIVSALYDLKAKILPIGKSEPVYDDANNGKLTYEVFFQVSCYYVESPKDITYPSYSPEYEHYGDVGSLEEAYSLMMHYVGFNNLSIEGVKKPDRRKILKYCIKEFSYQPLADCTTQLREWTFSPDGTLLSLPSIHYQRIENNEIKEQFLGVDKSSLKFKEGDIVEFDLFGIINLGIVAHLPYSIEETRRLYNANELLGSEHFFVILTLEEDENRFIQGEFAEGRDLSHPSMPVPDELKQRLEEKFRNRLPRIDYDKESEGIWS